MLFSKSSSFSERFDLQRDILQEVLGVFSLKNSLEWEEYEIESKLWWEAKESQGSKSSFLFENESLFIEIKLMV